MNDHSLSAIFFILFCYVFSLVLTIFVRKPLIKRALLDHPNERSSHKMPVPRGGGWALLAILGPGTVLISLYQHSLPFHAWLILALALLVAVSWLDDRHGINPFMRLTIHIIAAFFGSMSLAPHAMIFNGSIPFWIDRTLLIVGWAWFINLYNFMDGIDGLTCVETISIATGACALFSAFNIYDPFVSVLILMLTGVCLGFLALNWHPAKIFMGDVGSVPLGFLVGYILLTLALKGHVAAAFILPLYYIADSGITLFKRACRGEKVWQAHRQHFYQKAALGLGRHDRPVYWVIAANISLMSSALLAALHPLTGLVLAALIVAILLWAMHKAGRNIAAP